MKEVFLCIWQFMNYDFHYGNFTFNLWNVLEASIVLTIIGIAIGKIFFFVNGKR